MIHMDYFYELFEFSKFQCIELSMEEQKSPRFHKNIYIFNCISKMNKSFMGLKLLKGEMKNYK